MGSSSRRKNSKKKSSKLSSKARNMKKIRRSKSRKLGRRHDSSTDNSMSSHSISSPTDSYSSNSDDDSINSKSVSTSCSKDTYRRRSNVSRLRRNVKKRKKLTRRRSPSREDSRDLSRARKRKSSKKNGDSKSRKNSQRKKLKRDVGISSASSDSRSCSTCNESISDSERSEGERVRRRPRENKKGTRERRRGKLGSPLSTCRSPNQSSYSGYQDENRCISQSEETFMGEKNSRRLRSVIIIAEKAEPSVREENESEKDMQKEELVYDHDDYPSKSSSGEGSKKVSTPHPPNALVENVGFISDNGVTELTESRIYAHEQDHVRNPSSDEFETNSYIKESSSNISLPDSGSTGSDLEAILKQKALENLKKFRGALKSSVKPSAYQKDEDNGDHNGSSSSKTEIIQSKLPKQGGFTEVERDISDGGFTRKLLGTAKQRSSDPPGVAHFGSPNEEGPPIWRPVLGKSVMASSSFRETSSGVDSTLKQTESSSVSAVKSHVETETSLRNLEPTKSPSCSTNQGTARSSALVESAAAENQRLNNQPDQTKDGSQYQQKTMSVMRGGEMVQVNYKVYIPSRTPALARRQLKR